MREISDWMVAEVEVGVLGKGERGSWGVVVQLAIGEMVRRMFGLVVVVVLDMVVGPEV